MDAFLMHLGLALQATATPFSSLFGEDEDAPTSFRVPAARALLSSRLPFRRQSEPPPGRSPSMSLQQSNPANRTVKHRQIAHLAQQLGVLASRTEQLERLTVTTAEQASYMRLLAAYHASWCAFPSCSCGGERG